MELIHRGLQPGSPEFPGAPDDPRTAGLIDPDGYRIATGSSPREQAKAIGGFAFVASGGGAVGLLAGGVLTAASNW